MMEMNFEIDFNGYILFTFRVQMFVLFPAFKGKHLDKCQEKYILAQSAGKGHGKLFSYLQKKQACLVANNY